MAKTRIGSNAQFTGGSLGLSTIGSHCYAFSGNIEATTASQTVLSFQTGKGYIVGEFGFNAFVQASNVSVRQGALTISINDVSVAVLLTGDANEDMTSHIPQKILLPPYSFVECKAVAEADDSDNFATVIFTGRVYDA